MPTPAQTCRDLDEFLAAYLDGELEIGLEAAFERHLSVCPACVDYLAGYAEAVRLGKRACAPEADAEPPPELVAAIHAARACS